MNRRTRSKVALYALIAPYLLGTLFFVGLPALVAFGFAFTRYDALSAPVYEGLNNFKFIASYPAFLYAARNTVFFVILAVPLRLLTMLGLALLLNRPRRLVGLYRVAVYLPTVIPDIAYALMWAWAFNPVYGPINAVLNAFGLPSILWMVDRDTIYWILLVMSLFQIGEGFVVLLAGLRDIPESYYQVAQVDGATGWQQFRYVTLPLLQPWLVLLTFRDVVVGAQAVFTPAFIMIGMNRYYSVWYLPQMIYEEAFSRMRIGVASAIMVTWLIAAGILLAAAYRVVRGWGFADEL